MLRLLVGCWVMGLVAVGWVRWRRSGRLDPDRLRGDAMAGLAVGTFVWAVLVLAF